MKRIILMVIRLLYIAPYWFIKLLHMAGSDQYSWKEKYDFSAADHRSCQPGRQSGH